MRRVVLFLFLITGAACKQTTQEILETRVELLGGALQGSKVVYQPNPAIEISVFGAPNGAFTTSSCMAEVRVPGEDGHLQLTAPDSVCNNNSKGVLVKVQRTTKTWTKAGEITRTKVSWEFVRVKN